MNTFEHAINAAKASVDEMIKEERDDTDQNDNDLRRRRLFGSGILLARRDVESIAASKHRTTPALEAVQAFGASTDADRPVLILSGSTGCGKTYAAACAIASAGGTVVSSRELGRRCEPHQNELNAGIRMIDLKQRLLVLDDLGTETGVDDKRWSTAFGSFIDHRQMFGKTIITTSLTREAMDLRYDERITDRLNDCAVLVTIVTESMRRDRATDGRKT